LIFLLLACDPNLPTQVTLSGTVYDAPYLTGGVVSGESLRSLDELGTTVGTATSDAAGGFEIVVPAGAPFFLLLEGEGHPVTSFSGSAGVVDLPAGEGIPWIATEEWESELRADFVGCPTVAEGGTVVVGELRQAISGFAPWDLPVATTGSVTITDSAGRSHVVCVLDEDGTVLDSGAVGSKGIFAAFGLPEGPMIIETHYTTEAGEPLSDLYRGYAPPEGVAPFFPLYVAAT
jgi:hypothetical protein